MIIILVRLLLHLVILSNINILIQVNFATLFMRKFQLSLFTLCFIIVSKSTSYGQTWQALNPPVNIFNGTIYCTTLDTEGNIYAAGDFTNSSNARFVAKWNGSNWIELGSLNANNTILALASDAAGNIYATGGFTDGSFNTYVAKWNGSSWSMLGTGTAALKADGLIYSITVDNFGNVYAAGGFTNASGKYYVAKWDGSSWRELGTGVNALNANKDIYAITTDVLGNIYAGGWFTNANGKEYVAKWNGTSWSELGSGANAFNGNDFIRCLATDNSGNVYAGGNFRNNSNLYYLSKWNGTSWSELGTGSNSLNANNAIATIAVKNANEVYVAGYFSDGIGNHYIAKWNGSTWLQVNNPQSTLSAPDDIFSIQSDGANNIYAGGVFTNKSGHQFIAKWNGNEWNEPGSKGDPFYINTGPVYEIEGDTSGNIFVSGYGYSNGETRFLQHWNGNAWKEISLGKPGLSAFVDGEGPFQRSKRMAIDKAGNLYITGRLQITVDSGYDCVLKWNGSTWSILEDVPNALNTYNDNSAYNSITEIETDTNGNIYAIGNFVDSSSLLRDLAKWDGSKWSYLSYLNGGIQKLCIGNNGILYALGLFYLNGEYFSVGKLVNGVWEEVKNGNSRYKPPINNFFLTMEIDSKNNLYLNGEFTDSAGTHCLQKWDGTAWHNFAASKKLGNTLVIGKDNLYTTGNEEYSGDCRVKKWNGKDWIGIGTPVDADKVFPLGNILATDAAGNIYTEATSSSTGNFIAKFQYVQTQPPKLLSFYPKSGSLGTKVTLTGKDLIGTSAVKFGGKPASSITVKNDSTVIATVADGLTGNIAIETLAGADSLGIFTYTCDSIIGPVPVILSNGDSLLTASNANFYQWYLNNNKLENQNANSLQVTKTGFYHVETSADKVCWIPSIDYPILISRNQFTDSVKMNLYPNPSTGNFTIYIKLPQTTTVETYTKIFDSNGKLVLQTNKLIFYGSELRVPVILNSKGTYHVTVYVNKDSRQQTIVIM